MSVFTSMTESGYENLQPTVFRQVLFPRRIVGLSTVLIHVYRVLYQSDLQFAKVHSLHFGEADTVSRDLVRLAAITVFPDWLLALRSGLLCRTDAKRIQEKATACKTTVSFLFQSLGLLCGCLVGLTLRTRFQSSARARLCGVPQPMSPDYQHQATIIQPDLSQGPLSLGSRARTS